MVGRRSIWSNSTVKELVRSFIPVADEVGRLQRGKDPECLHFQKMAEHGHYKGRKRPTGTRQGMYATAPSGEFLASVNTRSAEKVAAMLRMALERWKELPREKRLLVYDPKAKKSQVRRQAARYPEDGLVLQVNSRDLPRERLPNDWRKLAWNQDYAWFTKDEVRRFLPDGELASLKKGTTHDVPAELVQRIARCHLVDNVRGQTRLFEAEHVEIAELSVTVVSVRRGELGIELEGRTRTEATGRWSVDGYKDRESPTEQKRGFEAKLLGRARYDVGSGRFTSFELVALGSRWGGSQYNGRSDDLDPAPMGIAFTISESKQRVAPASIWKY